MVKTNCIPTKVSVSTARNEVPTRIHPRKLDPKIPRSSPAIPVDAMVEDRLGFASVSDVTGILGWKTLVSHCNQASTNHRQFGSENTAVLKVVAIGYRHLGSLYTSEICVCKGLHFPLN
jgi:hypothetical protein